MVPSPLRRRVQGKQLVLGSFRASKMRRESVWDTRLLARRISSFRAAFILAILLALF